MQGAKFPPRLANGTPVFEIARAPSEPSFLLSSAGGGQSGTDVDVAPGCLSWHAVTTTHWSMVLSTTQLAKLHGTAEYTIDDRIVINGEADQSARLRDSRCQKPSLEEAVLPHFEQAGWLVATRRPLYATAKRSSSVCANAAKRSFSSFHTMMSAWRSSASGYTLILVRPIAMSSVFFSLVKTPSWTYGTPYFSQIALSAGWPFW
mmetsp:Transcript_13701/g.36273  ORF Transcript_13701/g.36273 Transcript_13701/m.36273 type:complete len:205 (+) Transcript_13701:183-797(+)